MIYCRITQVFRSNAKQYITQAYDLRDIFLHIRTRNLGYSTINHAWGFIISKQRDKSCIIFLRLIYVYYTIDRITYKILRLQMFHHNFSCYTNSLLLQYFPLIMWQYTMVMNGICNKYSVSEIIFL